MLCKTIKNESQLEKILNKHQKSTITSKLIGKKIELMTNITGINQTLALLWYGIKGLFLCNFDDYRLAQAKKKKITLDCKLISLQTLKQIVKKIFPNKNQIFVEDVAQEQALLTHLQLAYLNERWSKLKENNSLEVQSQKELTEVKKGLEEFLKQGNVGAIIPLSEVYFLYYFNIKKGNKQEIEEQYILPLLKKGAQQHDIQCMIRYSELLIEHKKNPIEREKLTFLWLKTISNKMALERLQNQMNFTPDQYHKVHRTLAKCYRHGKGTPKDEAEANTCDRKVESLFKPAP